MLESIYRPDRRPRVESLPANLFEGLPMPRNLDRREIVRLAGAAIGLATEILPTEALYDGKPGE